MLVLNRRQVESLLDPDRLIECLAPAMADLSAGRVSLPPRIAALVPEHDGLLGVMPAYVNSPPTLACKLVTVFPGNGSHGVPSHQAIVLIFDPATGTPVALMDGTALTAARTAAGSALATNLLARSDADVLTIVGTGVQAEAHVRTIPRVRHLREIRIVGRDHEKAAKLAKRVFEELGIRSTAMASVREALAGAAIVCATTHAVDPVIIGRWLDPGVHINSVGLNPQGRELDDDAIRRALVVVETRAAALTHAPGANDLRWPIRDGLIAETHIHAEVGEIVSGTRQGRTSPEQITLYKSVGVAVQDAVAARIVLAAAQERGVGVRIQI